jgi:uncharacterized protein
MSKTYFNEFLSYSLLAAFGFLLILVGVVIYDSNKPPTEAAVVASSDKPKPVTEQSTPWREIYPIVKPMQIGSTTVSASVAESWPDRIKGLSDTPYLPENVVKLFVFDSLGLHAIWMKDMNYEIDIIWLNEKGEIVHIVEAAAPESYPAMFAPKMMAKYVIETASGFVSKNQITTASVVTLPKL